VEKQEMEQIMEMLKTMLANNQEEMLAKLDAGQKEAEVMKYIQEQILPKMTAWKAEDKVLREKEAETEAIRARMDEDLKETTARIDA
jgi:hypothetical protein